MSLRKSLLSFRRRASTKESEGAETRSYSSSADDEQVYEAFLDGPAIHKKCVVGIDFGTTNSGFAYALTSDKRIRVVKKKEPTCVLLRKRDHKLIEFGLEARNFYRKLQAGRELLTKFSASEETSNWEDDYVYIDQDVKMQLYEDTGIGEVSYFEIVSAILRRIKETAMKRIRDDAKQELSTEDVLWVLTVPSMWRESDKQFMRRAAQHAEIIRDEFSGDLVIALESECAAVWTEVLFEHERKKKLEEGDRLLCLDCGGGTVDISAIRIVRTEREDTGEFELTMAQMLPPQGVKIGAQNIDMRFRKFMRHLLGDENFDRVWSQPDARMELQDGWEKVKCSVQAEHFSSKSRLKQKTLSLEITLAELNVKLADLVSGYNKMMKEKSKWVGRRKPIILDYKRNLARPSTVLILPPRLLHYCFDATVSRILEKTKEVLDRDLQGDVNHLILYGGLGSCEYLQFCVRREFSKKVHVHTPKGAGLAVMKGAVKYGMFPRIINSRRARMTIGVKVTIPFIRGKHNQQPHIKHKEYDSERREYFIRDVFKTFVVRGQLVDVNEKYKHTFAPASKNKDKVKFDIYASSSKKVEYVTEAGCIKLARIVVKVEKGSMRNLTCALSFGYTEIRAYILDDEGNVVREVPLQFDRVGENAIISEAEDPEQRVVVTESDL